MIYIESELSNVRYELENYASRLRLYDNQITSENAPGKPESQSGFLGSIDIWCGFLWIQNESFSLSSDSVKLSDASNTLQIAG